jgi:hypothetical protein
MKKQYIVLVSMLSLIGCATTNQSSAPDIKSTVESNSSIKEANVSMTIEPTQNEAKKDVNKTQDKIKEIELLFETAMKLSSDGNHSMALAKCEKILGKTESKDVENIKKAKSCIDKEKKIIENEKNKREEMKISQMFDDAKKLKDSEALSKYDEIIQYTENSSIKKQAFIEKKRVIDTLSIENTKLAKFYFEYATNTSFYEYFKKSGDLYFHYSDMMNQVERNKALASYLAFYKYVENDDEMLYKIGYLYTLSKDWVNAKKFISESKRLGNYDAKQLWIDKKLYSR